MGGRNQNNLSNDKPFFYFCYLFFAFKKIIFKNSQHCGSSITEKDTAGIFYFFHCILYKFEAISSTKKLFSIRQDIINIVSGYKVIFFSYPTGGTFSLNCPKKFPGGS